MTDKKNLDHIPERERWVHENPEILASIQQGIKDAEEGRVSSIDLGSLDDDEADNEN